MEFFAFFWYYYNLSNARDLQEFISSLTTYDRGSGEILKLLGSGPNVAEFLFRLSALSHDISMLC